MRLKGKVANWKDDQGYGFITPHGEGGTVFVHIKAMENRQRRPAVGDVVTYELGSDQKGRERAVNVRFSGERPREATPARAGRSSLVLAACFLAVVAGSALVGKLPWAVLGLYLAASAGAFAAYWVDKTAARSGRWRTPESTLHLWGLAGGWPGALAAQRLLRHKSSKQSFQAVFWVTVVLNCALFVWLLTRQGEELLRTILGA